MFRSRDNGRVRSLIICDIVFQLNIKRNSFIWRVQNDGHLNSKKIKCLHRVPS